MNIMSMNKSEKDLIARLSVDEMNVINNLLYDWFNKHKHSPTIDKATLNLYKDSIIVRDIGMYGHLDNFAIETLNDAVSIINLVNKP